MNVVIKLKYRNIFQKKLSNYVIDFLLEKISYNRIINTQMCINKHRLGFG